MSLFGALAVSASGMDAQRVRAELITENLANADTTRTPQGGPYRRKDAVFTSASMSTGASFGESFAQAMSGGSNRSLEGVSVSRINIDETDPERRYLPGHPDADPQGYVAFPKISPAEEMVDLMAASRGYQANVTAIASVKDMIARSIELFR